MSGVWRTTNDDKPTAIEHSFVKMRSMGDALMPWYLYINVQTLSIKAASTP
jgi:hypothetical protein